MKPPHSDQNRNKSVEELHQFFQGFECPDTNLLVSGLGRPVVDFAGERIRDSLLGGLGFDLFQVNLEQPRQNKRLSLFRFSY